MQPHGLQEKENKPNDDTFLNESQDMTSSNLCAPDTLEFVQGISFYFLVNLFNTKTSSEDCDHYGCIFLNSFLSNYYRQPHKFFSSNG